MSLRGERVVVIGGTAGIGLAVAEAAAREGADVVVASRRQAAVDSALRRLPGGAEGMCST
nr:SDR family NAD(P)-dependent oxidoreductase [Streptomyces sp. S1D4-11]